MTTPPSDVRASDALDPAAASTSYATEIAALLWPRPWSRPRSTRSGAAQAAAHRDMYVFPSRRRPRLLVPADLPGAAVMLQRLGNDRTTFVGPMRRALRSTVGSPLFTMARWPRLRVETADPGADSMERHLAEVLGTDVRIGVVLGPRRVNQKPVLQVFATDGTLLAFAKVGHNPLTAGLVRHEAASLAAVEGLRPRSFRAPEPLHAGQWAGLDLLVMSPLATDPGRPVPADRRTAAMIELARLGELRRGPLRDSSFLGRLAADVDRLADQPHGTHLPAAVSAIDLAHGDLELTFGSWHGDWGPWNMGMQGDVVQLWDWERHEADVPLGLDGLHFLVQQARAQHPDESAQEDMILRGVASALEPFGVPAHLHDASLQLYLLAIAVRYVDALRHGARPDFERRTSWVVSLLMRLLEQSPSTLPEGRS